MTSWDDLPLDLVCRAWDLGMVVKIAQDFDEFKMIEEQRWAAYFQPSRMKIVLSGSYSPAYTAQDLAHEIGHAEQWREGNWYCGRDGVRLFECEMDAVKRGARYIDMTENYWANFLGYGERLGLEHLGRS